MPDDASDPRDERSRPTADASTDRIERSMRLQAPRARVWRALTDAEEFGRWFGCDLRGQSFRAGERTRGPITFPGYEHVFFDVVVERIQPETLFSYRWHPHAVEQGVDYSGEERTLVAFTLEDAPGGGTVLKVVESGFDRVPPGRRLQAFRMNTQGWEGQMDHLARHLANPPRNDGAPDPTPA